MLPMICTDHRMHTRHGMQVSCLNMTYREARRHSKAFCNIVCFNAANLPGQSREQCLYT
jgi:hypothetical protein